MGRASVKLFLLGGTIAMDRPSKDAGQEQNKRPALKAGLVPLVDAAALCRAVPGLDQIAAITPVTLALCASGHLTVSHGLAVAQAIQAASAEDPHITGFVVAQGTDTLEEMAFLLDCLLDIPQPVVVTGALRSPTQISADGPANILAAALCATEPRLAPAGVVVVLDDTVHSARYVQKTDSSALASFQSPGMGPVGRVVEGTVRLFALPTAGPILPFNDTRGNCITPEIDTLPRVLLLKSCLGDDGYLLERVQPHDCHGLVIEGFGAGHLPVCYGPLLSALTRKIPVILASRVGAGAVFEQTYGYEGAEIDLIARGLIPAGFLGGLKARILLIVLLLSGADMAEIKRVFAHMALGPL